MAKHQRPPRDGLVRARPGVELRDATDGGMPTLTGHFAVFNEWTEINSHYEGNFLERFAPGAFRKTLDENRDIKVLFQHGQDPQIGDKPLGPIDLLEEDERGMRYEVQLLDTSYNRDLMPGLQAGLYGASFRFGVVREDLNRNPEPSDYNPEALPERTVKEAGLAEFGPVTFPAYAGATAGIRSLTDEFHFARLAADPESLRNLLTYVLGEERQDESPEESEDTAPAEDAGAPAPPPNRAPRAQTIYGLRKDAPSWRL